MIFKQYLNRVTWCAIVCLVFSQGTFAQAISGDEKIPPPLINLLKKTDAEGESAALGHAKAHGIRFYHKTGQEALFPLILGMKPGYSPANFDKSWLESRGIKIDATSRSYIRVLVPLRLMRLLAQHPQIRSLNMPKRPIPLSIGLGSTVSESVHLTNADSLQQENIHGDSVKVAVVDMGFSGYASAKTSGDLPSSAVAIDLPGTYDNPIDAVTNHGTGVAEQVMDMAPNAKLYLIMVNDDVDMQNAVDTIRARNIRIVNHSIGWSGFGYYDDHGFIDSLVNYSHDHDGVFWTVAAGNEAQRHWRGKWSVAMDGDSLLQFQTGVKTMNITGTDGALTSIYLSWNEFNNPITDLNMYLYDINNNLVASSELVQPTYVPVEAIDFTYSSANGPYHIKVKKKLGNILADTFDVTVFSPDANVQYPVPGSSYMEPASAHGAFTVAAVSPSNWALASPAVEVFSSRGHTNDGRMKPDIAAPDSTKMHAFSGLNQMGTSYSGPVVAGAAALLLQKYPSLTVTTLADSLRGMAKDVGPTGTDTLFGAGLLYVCLPPPVFLSPSNNASGLATSQTLTWSTVGNASNYHVQVATDNLFTNIINQDSTLTAGSKSINGLTNGTTYYWHVRSKNSHGVSPWSGYWTFTIIRQFSLTINATNGTVSASPSSSPYDSGAAVTLTPNPSANYHFSSWSGDLTGTSNPGSITMIKNENITANFVINSYTVTVSAGSGGTVKPSGAQSVNYNDTLRDTAVANTGYSFVNWSVTGGVTTASGGANGKFVVTGTGTVHANFSVNSYAVTASAGSGGTVKPSGSQSVNYNDTLRDTAVAITGYSFVNWTVSGGVTTASGDANGKFVVTGTGTVQANFAINSYTVTASAGAGGTVKPLGGQSVNYNDTLRDTAVANTGYTFANWSVTGGVATVAGGANGKFVVTGTGTVQANFTINSYSVTASAGTGGTVKPLGGQSVNYNDTLRDTAVANTGYSFVNWSVSGGVATVAGGANGKFVVTGTGTVQAIFLINSYTVTASAGSGGTVKPSGSQSVNYNDTLRDTAVANTGYSFVNWSVSGGVATVAGGANGKFVVTGTGTVQAIFSIKVYSLTVTAVNGTVSKSPDQTGYDSGSSVTLTPVPSTGYHFLSWSGDLTGTANPGTITMIKNENVTANFAITSYTVTASSGSGGTVKPSGSQTVNYGDTVRDTATPNAGYSFVNWTVTGGVAVVISGAAGKFLVTGSGTIQASFTINTYALTITATNGSVTKSPDQAVYDSGTVVTLTPVTSTGYHFSSWSGDLTGTANPGSIIMTGAKNITAGFIINVPDSPVLVSPVNNSVNVDASPVFAWNAAARALTYQVQVSTTTLFTDTVTGDTGLTVLSKTKGPFLDNTTYYWRVNAKNAGGVGAWSAVWSFTTLPPVPSQVQLTSPKDTARIPVDSVVFKWAKSMPLVNRYMLEIAKDSSMTNMVYSDTAIIDTQKAYKGLADKTTYWWHVKAHNSAGWGSVSAAFRFTIAIPSTAVIPKNFSFAMNGMWNSRSFISYALPAEARVVIRLYGIGGRLIAILCDSYQPAGYYHVPINRMKLSNGYYLLDFRAGDHVVKKKLSLFR